MPRFAKKPRDPSPTKSPTGPRRPGVVQVVHGQALRRHRPAPAGACPGPPAEAGASGRWRCRRLFHSGREMPRATRRNENPDGPRTGWPDRYAAAEAAVRSAGRWSCADRPSRGSRRSGPMWKDRPAKPRSSGAPLPVSSAPMSASITPSVKSRCTMAKLGPLPLRVLFRRPCLLIVGELERQAVAAIPMAARRDDQIGGDRLRDRRFGPAARRHDNGSPEPLRQNPGSGRGGPTH